MRIAVVSRSTLDLPFWLAREQGYFRNEGIDAEIILLRASPTVQAMIGGSVDFGTATGTSVSAAVTGADVRLVMAMSQRPSFDLEAAGKFAYNAITFICNTGDKERIPCRKYLSH